MKKRETKNRKNKGHLLWRIVLVMLVFSGAGCAPEVLSTEALYTKYANYPFELAEQDNASQLLLLAQEQLQQGHYTQGLTHLENYMAEHPQALYAMMAKGVTLVKLGEYRKAKTCFKILLESGDAYHDEALWETAMVYLKQDYPQATVFNLQQVSPDSPHYKDAQGLVKTLQGMMDKNQKTKPVQD